MPKHMRPRELVGANGLIHGGTSLAILLGMIGGSLAMAFEPGRWLVACGCVMMAVIGWCASVCITLAEPADASIALNLIPYGQALRRLDFVRDTDIVFWI